MIIDIDQPKSVVSAIKKLSKGWFNSETLYQTIKSNSSFDPCKFWQYPLHMISEISNNLSCTPEEFLRIFVEKCLLYNCYLMGYHCTRHSDKSVFLKNGILPLSKDIITFSDNQNSGQTGDVLRYRMEKGTGPYFLLSYDAAKVSDNAFCQKGSEILIKCKGSLIGNNPSKSKPLIFHCSIPFSLLSDHDYYLFCIFRAYFNFIDPEGNENLFLGYSIDLENSPLNPKYILKVEELGL